MLDNNQPVPLRTWYEADHIQVFVTELSEGKVRNRYGEVVKMDKELVNGLLSRIDSESYFIKLATEYGNEEMLDDGYDVYTVERDKFFVEHRQLIEAYTLPAELMDDAAKVMQIFNYIGYYNADRITVNEISKVFFETNIQLDNPVEEDAWFMGCYAMNNLVLCDILDTYAMREGLAAPEPFVSKVDLERDFFYMSDTPSSKLCLTLERWTDLEHPLKATLSVAGRPLINIDPNKKYDFIAELQALGAKYQA